MSNLFSNFVALTTAIVSAIAIIKLLHKFFKWCSTNPIKQYVEQTAVNKIAQDKLITLYNQLNETERQLLKKYKAGEDEQTKIVKEPLILNHDHIKLKYLGLINECNNTLDSTENIRTIIETTIEKQRLQKQIQEYKQWEANLRQQQQGTTVLNEQKLQIQKQINDNTQQIQQLALQVQQLHNIREQIQQQSQNHPERQQQFQLQIQQTVTQEQSIQQQIQQMTQQISQLNQIE